jgi:hypothetical protein
MPGPTKAEVGELRRRMRGLDASTDAIVGELGRRYGVRPRQAYRLAHGWDQAEATAQYNQLVQHRGPEHDGRDSMTPSRMSEYERWPNSGRRPSPYVLRTLAGLYSTAVDRLLDHDDLQALGPAERAALTTAAAGRPSGPVVVQKVDGTMECERIIRRRRRDALVELIRASSGLDNDLEEFIMASAEQSAEAALWAQAHGIGEANLPILQEQLASLVAQFEHTAPRQMLGRALVVRNRALDLLDDRQPTAGQLRDLHIVAGTACALLAWMSGDLAQHHAALTHAASAWGFADRADQPLLRALVRTVQAKSAYWANRVGESADHARDGLTYLTAENTSTIGVLLASMLARAEARLGHAEQANEALQRAQAERDGIGDPAEAGGLFACSTVGQACFAAGAHLTLGDAPAALTAADEAEGAHAQAVVAGEPPAYRSITMARINALTARLQLGQLDGAQATFDRIAELPAERRIQTFVQRLNRATTTLNSDRYRTDPAARTLYDEINDFRRANAARMLPAAESWERPNK